MTGAPLNRDYDVALTRFRRAAGLFGATVLMTTPRQSLSPKFAAVSGVIGCVATPKTAAPNFSCRQELLQNIARHIGRNREADADIAAGI